MWSQLSHPNLLPFYGIYYLEDRHGRVCLVSPWMNNGNIKDYLPENPRVNRVLLVVFVVVRRTNCSDCDKGVRCCCWRVIPASKSYCSRRSKGDEYPLVYVSENIVNRD